MTSHNLLFLLGHPCSGTSFIANCLNDVPGFETITGRRKLDDFVSDLQPSISQYSPDCRVVECNVGDSTNSHSESTGSILDWIIAKDVPVIHVVRDNPIDSLVAHWYELKQPIPDAEHAILEISAMRSATSNIQNMLAHANCLELRYEQLCQSNGTISKLVLHQIGKLLGLEIDFQRCQSIRLDTRSNSNEQNRLKLALRPSLMKQGFGNLFDLPRAA